MLIVYNHENYIYFKQKDMTLTKFKLCCHNNVKILINNNNRNIWPHLIYIYIYVFGILSKGTLCK